MTEEPIDLHGHFEGSMTEKSHTPIKVGIEDDLDEFLISVEMT